MPAPGGGGGGGGGSLSAKAQTALGLPEGFKAWTPFPFEGMNTQDSQIAIDDKEFLWIENFIKLGKGNLRTAWDTGEPSFTASGVQTIVYFSFYTIATLAQGVRPFVAVFLSDGSAVQVDLITLVQTTIGPVGTFYTATEFLPYARQWGTQYLLICNRNTQNDFWAWDGSLLYTAGTAAPNGVTILAGGAKYSSTPTTYIFGGLGSGIVLDVLIADGQVVEAIIENPGTGYQVGDQVQVAFSGGGSDNGAIITANLTATGVGAVNISAYGHGYTSASVSFSGGGGSGAAGTVVLNNGVRAATLSNGGSGYTYAYVTFTGGGGWGAQGSANIVGGVVQSVTITQPGYNYTSAPGIIISGDGIGAIGTVSVGFSEIIGVHMTSAGSNYTSPPIVTFSGPGSGARATALLQPTSVGGVTVIGSGSDFTTVPLISFVGGGGAGATGIVVLNPTTIARINVTAGGVGYTSAPTVAIDSTTGTGATATATVLNGQVAAITLTNPGSGYEDQPTVVLTGGGGAGAGAVAILTPTGINSVSLQSAGEYYTSPPSLQISGGANDAAIATITLMPYGVSGSAMEEFLSRLWIINPATSPFQTIPPGGQYQFSAPGDFIDFATSDGGGSAINTNLFLQTQYTNLRQSSGYLYLFGDGSASVVFNVSTSGAPIQTNYTYQTTDPQAGLLFRDCLQDFGKAEIISNNTGIYGLYGGSVTKISSKMDGIFRMAQFPALTSIAPPSGTLAPYTNVNANAILPSAAIATIFDIKHYMMLMTIVDPDTSQLRNALVAWNEKDWSILSQSVDFTFIATQKVGSGYVAWGTDGKSLYPLFNAPSASLTKRLDTKFYGAETGIISKELLAVWMQASDNSITEAGITGDLTVVASGLAVDQAQNPEFQSIRNATVSNTFIQPPTFTAPAPYFSLWGSTPGSVPGLSIGVRFSSQSPDFTIGNLVLGYKDFTALF